MSYAAPFSLLSFHLPDRDDLADGRLTWPLAGSLTIHVVVFIALLSLRFASSLEQSTGSYEVTLVTLPEISASPTASRENKSKSARNTDKVPPPKAMTRKAPKVAPPITAGRPPDSVPQEKPKVPERVTDSLVGALDSVVLPEPQSLALHQKAAPLPPPPLPPLPVSADPKQNAGQIPLPREDDAEVPKPERVTDSLVSPLDSVVVPKPQAPALPQEAEAVQTPVRPSPPMKQAAAAEMNVQPIQAPPQPPELVIEKPQTPTPPPRADLLAQRLKQAVGTIVVPKKPEQTSKPVNSIVTPEGKPKQDITKTPRSSGITLPRRAPRLAAVAPPEPPKKEKSLQTTRKRSTVETLTQAIQSVKIPDRITKTPQPVSGAVPLVRESSPKHPEATEAQNMPRTIVPPQAPQLARVPADQTLVASEAAVPKTSSESDTLKRQIAKLAIPELSALEAPKPVSKQTESGTEAMPGLLLAPSCSNADWKDEVEKKIHGIHKKIYRYTHRVESPAILTFRVMRNGQLTDLDVVRSSGNEKFDLAAKRAVLAAIPLPPFHANMTKPSCQVQHTFRDQRNP